MTAPTNLLLAPWNQIHESAHEYPYIMIVSTVAFAALGLSLIFVIPTFFETSLLAFYGAQMAGMILGGFGTLSFSSLWSHYKHMFLNINSEMTTKVFKEGEFLENRVFYHEDVPILEFSTPEPYDAGFAHGYLLGENIQELWYGYAKVFFYGFNERLAQITQEYTISNSYRTEIEGLVDGYNRWREEEDQRQNLFISSEKLIYDELLMFQLLFEIAAEAQDEPRNACSSAVYSQNGEVVHGSLLDHYSGSLLGKNTILFKRPASDTSLEISYVGFPGMIAPLRGMNEQGLSASFNTVSNNGRGNGIPFNFLLRETLESCSSIREAAEYVEQSPQARKSHLLMLSDPNSAVCLQYIRDQNTFRVDALTPNEQGMLCVTNHPISQRELGESYNNYQGNSSFERFARLLRQMQGEAERNANPTEVVNRALSSVDVQYTTQIISMNPAQRSMQLHFSNFHAASSDVDLRDLPSNVLFSNHTIHQN